MSTDFQSYNAGYVPGADTAPLISSFQHARITGETHRAVFTDGVLTQDTSLQESATGADTSAFAGTSGWESTARNPNGLPVTSLLPTTLVTLGGVQAPVSSFVRAGLLTQMPDGTYTEATAAAEVAPEDTSDILPMEPESMAAVNAALEPLPQDAYDGLAAVAVGVALGTVDAAALAHRFTAVSGLGGEDAAQRIAFVQSAYQAHADHAVTSRSGLSAEDLPGFWQWARDTRRSELQQAIQAQVSRNDVKGYAQLAARWQAATAPSIASIKAAGFQTRNLGQKDEVFIGGMWQTPGAAAKIGLF